MFSKKKRGNRKEAYIVGGSLLTAVKEVCLDAEWIELMEEAKAMGITIGEIQQFFTEMEEKDADKL